MANLFFSYSHKDEELRNELEIHLSMLKREGLLAAWHDRRITAGDEIDSRISSALENADVILLLVSAYFLDSNYCFDIEMKRALAKHQEGTARVIPVILRPCDWHSAPFGKLRATPPDGKAVSMFANRDEALALVTKDIREAITALGKNLSTNSAPKRPSVDGPESTRVETLRSSNLRVKRSFSDEEIDRFLEQAFQYISRFFESSLQELSDRNPQVTTRFRQVDSNSFTASIYASGKRVSECTIWMGGHRPFPNGIAYSSSITDARNGYNEMLSVENDGYSLHLRASGMSMTRTRSSPNNLSLEGAAELYWSILIERLQ